MESKSKISANIQSSKTLIKLAIASGILSLILLIGCVILATGDNVYVESVIFSMGLIPFSMALLFSISAFFYGILGSSSAQEEEEKFLLLKRKEGSSNIINVEEDVRFTATKTFQNYQKFAPYVLALMGALIILAYLAFFYYDWNLAKESSVLKESFDQFLKKNALANSQVTIVAIIFMIISAFAGAFFSGQSRVKAYRYLKGVGAYLSLAFIIMIFAIINSIAESYHILEWFESVFKYVTFIIFTILAVELILNFIIEFYRPRTINESRPIFESKILAIFTEPGGVMRNIAETLDYQFGFKVSSTWIYGFIERALFPLILVWLLILWSFSSIHIVKIGELGVREEFGQIVANKNLLEPGIYFSKPWPFATIKCFSFNQIRQITVGNEPRKIGEEIIVEDHGHSHGPKQKPVKHYVTVQHVVTWTEAHAHGNHGEIYFLLPSANSNNAKSKNEKNVSTVDLLAFSIPVQYRIKKDGIFDYAYRNANTDITVKQISNAVITEYLASATISEVMSTQRKEAEQVISQRIQKAADDANLGIEIVSVNLTGVHPPMENNTSLAFHEARIAEEKANATVLNAKVYSDNLLPIAAIKALQVDEEAKSYKYANTKIAGAEKLRFETQLKSYNIMPSMFMLNSYLDFLEQDCKDIRKYIISSSLKNEVYELNLEEKNSLDLIDVGFDGIGQ